MRSDINTSIETLSGIQDTINDEIRAEHWHPASLGVSVVDEAEVEEMISDSDDISHDPESFVEDEYEEHVEDDIE